MNFSKLSLAAVIAFAFTAGTLLADDSFEYKGYMRVGNEWTTSLHAPTQFGINGAQKWTGRLGNENQSRAGEDPFFLEQTFVKNWKNDANNWAKAVVLLNYHGKITGDTDDYQLAGGTAKGTDQTGGTHMRIRQAFVEMGGLGFSADTSFWAGKRFLNRDDIHVLDWFFLDFSGTGFGAANIAGLGFDVAYIQRLRTSAADDIANSDDGRYSMNTLVLKYENDLVRVDAAYGSAPKTKGVNEKAMSGFMGSVIYKPERFFFVTDGSSKVIVQYAKGQMANCMWYGNRFTNVTATGDDGWQANQDMVKKNYAYDIVFTGVSQLADNINMQPAFGYRFFHLDRSDESADGSTKWDSKHIFAVLRAQYFLNSNLGFAVEGGYSKAEGDEAWGGGPASWAALGWNGTDAGTELKITPAVILTMDTSFYTRPQIRLYGTYKSVSDSFKPIAGEFKKKNSAFVWGCQAEAWW